MTTTKRLLKELSPEEYKLICHIRNQRRRALGQTVCFTVTITGNQIKCKTLVDKREKKPYNVR